MTARHFTMNRPGPRTQFTTRQEGHQAAKRMWICRACWRTSSEKIKQCACGEKSLEYFASRKEGYRFMTLARMEEDGEIRGLRIHTKWPLKTIDPTGGVVSVLHYVDDFNYHDAASGRLVIEDCKGSDKRAAMDPVFMLKRQWFEAQYGMTITIT